MAARAVPRLGGWRAGCGVLAGVLPSRDFTLAG
jgi:hypothetical protein